MNFVLIGVGFLIFAFISMQLLMVRMAKRSKGVQINGLEGSLKNLEKKGSRGLVYFYSPSCGACRAQTPIIKEMQKKYKNIYDVDISRDMKTARVFGIKATPTTISVQDGIIKEVLLGAKGRQTLEKIIQN
ncbi:MAG TPA: thioredoxin family protein [Ignavibacteriales bacterium]|nr:thioredoxin family protein [Ignavibacteriales bacterium]